MDARAARVWNYYNRQDIFYKIRDWPKWVQDLMLLEHRKNRDRYQLFFFFASNGLPPSECALWTLCTDVKQGGIVTAGYDDSAWRHVEQMRKQLLDGTLFKGTKKAYSMILNKVVYF